MADAAEGTRARRARAGIPDEVRHREKWRLALDMLDQRLGQWDLPKRLVVADSGYGDATEFRLGLEERGLSYVLQVTPTATAHPGQATPVTRPYRGRGPRPAPVYPDTPATLRELALATGRTASPANPTAACPRPPCSSNGHPEAPEPVKYWLGHVAPGERGDRARLRDDDAIARRRGFR